MADWSIANLTTAVTGIASTALNVDAVVGTTYDYLWERDGSVIEIVMNRSNRLGSISFDEARTLYLPDSKSFVSINDSQDRPPTGQLYPRFTK